MSDFNTYIKIGLVIGVMQATFVAIWFIMLYNRNRIRQRTAKEAQSMALFIHMHPVGRHNMFISIDSLIGTGLAAVSMSVSTNIIFWPSAPFVWGYVIYEHRSKQKSDVDITLELYDLVNSRYT